MKKSILLLQHKLHYNFGIHALYRNITKALAHYLCKDTLKTCAAVLLTMLILIPLAACSSDSAKNTAPSAISAEKQPVQAFGIVKAQETIEITAPFTVNIREIHVKEGQPISAGDTLAQYDTNEADIQLKLMEQELAAIKAKTEARIKMLEEKKKLLNNNMDPELLKLEKSLEAAKVKYLVAIEDVSRLQVLKDSGTATEKAYRDSFVISEISRLSSEELQLSLESLKTSKLKDIQLEEMQINQESSEIKLLELKISLMRDKMNKDFFKQNKILSPVSKGIVEKTSCRQGAEALEKSVLFNIINTDTLIVEANVDEQFIKDVHLGARAYIIPESDRSLEYKGKVTFISSIAILHNGETVIAVQITPDDKGITLLPGSNAEIDILTE